MWGGTAVLINAPLLTVVERLAGPGTALAVQTPEGIFYIEKESIRSLTAEGR